MLRGLLKLTWIEIKIFMREPLGAIGTIGIPVLVFLVAGRMVGRPSALTSPAASNFIGVGLPVLASVLILISAVLSLVTIISIYREGGILKRLRATPLRPQTILTAHVIVKLLLSAATLVLMVAVGQTLLSGRHSRPLVGFTSGASDQHLQHFVDRLSHRQPGSHGALCAAHWRGHHVSDDGDFGTFRCRLHRCRQRFKPWPRVLPLTYAVSLLEGIWKGDAWWAHARDLAALAVSFAVCTALSAKSIPLGVALIQHCNQRPYPDNGR